MSIVKTDFGWSEEWLQEVIIVQKASLYIYKIEKILKKILALSEDRTPTVEKKKDVYRTIVVTTQPNQISISNRLFIDI